MDVSSPEIQPQRTTKKSSEMAPDISKLGNSLVTKFHVLMRIAQIYDAKNAALVQFIQESLEVINTLVEREGGFSLKIANDEFFFNEQRLRYSVEGFTSFKYLLTSGKRS